MQEIDQVTAWIRVGDTLKKIAENPSDSPFCATYEEAALNAENANPWFTRKQIDTAITGVAKMLSADEFSKWTSRYSRVISKPKRVGVIMAGNIPMAGFHDLLCVLLSEHKLEAKLSSSDRYLLPFITEILCSYMPELKNRFEFVDQLKNVDAVIATGSNNTGRYFDYYFGKIPHIFRKNRNSAAVITGDENEFDLILLGRDIFTYYGLGCRNISKVFVPENYNFNDFFQAMMHYSYVLEHNKYMNNHDYYQAILLLNMQPFLTNNFLIILEEKSLPSPVGVLHFEKYYNEEDLNAKLGEIKPQLQCVVRKNSDIPPGQAQFPAIDDYADGVDTMEFLYQV